MGRLNISNIAKLVEKRREAGDNSQKGTGGNRGGTGGGRRLPPVFPHRLCSVLSVANFFEDIYQIA